MDRHVDIEKEKYGYAVRGYQSRASDWEHYTGYATLPAALQDAKNYLEVVTHDFLKGEEKMGCKDVIKVGDKVRVTDDSWALELRDGLLLTGRAITQAHWKVAAVGHRLPTPAGVSIKNDTIITDELQKKRVVFIKQCFLQLVDVCPNCGTRVKR